MINDEKLKKLIQTYIQAKNSGELGDEENYHERMESYRKWQLENILDYDKLTHYSDEEFATKFGEMFDYSDGAGNSRSRNRIIHFKTDESRLAVRQKFEQMIHFILDPNNDPFTLLEKILEPNSEYKVPGIGEHMTTTFINAKYPNVPPINSSTKKFFANIGEPLPVKCSDAQHIVNEFFNDVVEYSNGELTYDDANHICWYSSKIESGRRFMEQYYSVTFENKLVHHRARADQEETVDDIYARLMAIHEQAIKEKK